MVEVSVREGVRNARTLKLTYLVLQAAAIQQSRKGVGARLRLRLLERAEQGDPFRRAARGELEVLELAARGKDGVRSRRVHHTDGAPGDADRYAHCRARAARSALEVVTRADGIARFSTNQPP